MKKLLYDFTFTDSFGSPKEEIMKEANRVAETEIRRMLYTNPWTLKESREPDTTDEGLVYYFEIYTEETVGRTLLIDDLRDLKADRVARTFEDGLKALRYEGPWDLLILDHDLGDPSPGATGYDIMNWLEVNQEFLPGRIELVTSNPVGREKMRVVIERLYQKS